MSTPIVTPVTLTQMEAVLYASPSLLTDIEQGVLRGAVEAVQAARPGEERRAAVAALTNARHMVVGWVLSRQAAAARRAAAR